LNQEFGLLDDDSRRVLGLATEEANLLNHSFIGTEHLLLGLLRNEDAIAFMVLTDLGITLEAARQRIEDTIGLAGSPPAGAIPFTPRTRKVLELSLREARQFDHDDIAPQHILLGLVREGQGVASQVLVGLGADLAHVRQEVTRRISKAEPGA
jgi:ATP-dependent Clp protease ATP-binding subunit ClpC